MSRLLRAAVLAATLCSSAVGVAQPNVEQARTFFELGAKAYDAQQYLAAIDLFGQAYKLAPREGLLFSIAQAYRRQYYSDPQPGYLRVAVEKYQEYLERAGTGGRAADARQALAELQPVLDRLGAEAAVAPLPGTAESKSRLMVSTKVKGARIALDGAAPQPVPLIAEVTPGSHRIRVSAEGYFDEDRDIAAAEGGVVGLDIPLRAKPARVAIQTGDGAQVSVNGRLVGETPLPAPLELRAGRHFVAVTMNGHDAFAEEIPLARGEKRDLQVDLPTTAQRYASYVMITTGVTAAAAGVLFTGFALSAQNQAQDIYDKLATQNITTTERDEYDTLVSKRDEIRRLAVVFYGAGALIGGIGLLLYAFDEPSLDAPASRFSAEPEDGDEPETDAGPNLDIAAVPVWVPGGAMGVVTATF